MQESKTTLEYLERRAEDSPDWHHALTWWREIRSAFPHILDFSVYDTTPEVLGEDTETVALYIMTTNISAEVCFDGDGLCYWYACDHSEGKSEDRLENAGRLNYWIEKVSQENSYF